MSQTSSPSSVISGIDHVVICVHDLAEAHATYARMGFTITPRGLHSVGTQNHCIMLGEDYIELLAVPKTHPTTAFYSNFLATGEGLAALALAAPSAVGAREHLLAAGFGCSEVSELSRPVEFNGMTGLARFALTFMHDGQTPGVRTFVCEHRTRELVWRPEFRAHTNGAQHLSEVVLVDEAPAAVLDPYAKVFGVTPVAQRIVPRGGARLGAASAAQLAKRLPNVWISARPDPAAAVLAISVADAERTAAQLAANGFNPVRLADGGVAVNAQEAHGIALVFH